jgi:hypothetical protein
MPARSRSLDEEHRFVIACRSRNLILKRGAGFRIVQLLKPRFTRR